MKVSLVVTVLNEEKSIDSFLCSVAEQTLKPDEFIVVDGGSVDWTVEKLEESKVKSTVIIKKGANRSLGRNIGIEYAKNEIIAVTDAGCILDKNWLWEITKPFNENVNVVSGYYLPKTETIFQKCVAPYFCVMPEEIKERMKDKHFQFLASSRSFAFKKSVWSKVGGYPENMNYCEDLVFDQKIRLSGFKFLFAPKAIVYWPQQKNLVNVFKQFFNYANGDGQVFNSPFQTHSIKISLLFLRFVVFLFLFILSFWSIILWGIFVFSSILYITFAILKNYRYVKNFSAFFYLPVIQIIADVAVVAGALKGIFYKKTR